MNNALFEKEYYLLNKILNNSPINHKEFSYRINKLNDIYNRMIESNEIDPSFYSVAHEIKSIDLFSSFPYFNVSNDSKSESGPDFTLLNKYYIECVSSSYGKKNKENVKQIKDSNIIDYNILLNIINTRLTQSIGEKLCFYKKHLDNGSMNSSNPYIIFLSPGEMVYDYHPGIYTEDFNKILYGVGHETMTINKRTGKIVYLGYSHNDYILNHNNSEINCNIFASNDYSSISAIMFTSADLNELYTKENTFLFVNPLAKNPIKIKDFHSFVYWNVKKKGDGNYYIPRYKGRDMSYKRAKKYL